MATKRKYNKWTTEQMEAAIAEFRKGEISLNKCCLKYNIAKPTFKRHMEGKNKIANGGIKKMGKNNIFTSR